MCHWISLTSATIFRAQQLFPSVSIAVFNDLKSFCKRRRARVLLWRGVDGAPFYCCSVEHKGNFVILGDNELSGLSDQIKLTLRGRQVV